MPEVSTERLVEIFVEVADTLVDDFDVIEFVQMVVSRTTEVLDVSAAGVLLTDQQGDLQFVAASHEASRMLELFQLISREGPCIEAFQTKVLVIAPDLSQTTTRWPRFSERALGGGFRSVHAVPLRLRTDVIGTLNLFGTHVGPLGAADVKILQALADVTTIGLLQERSISSGETLTEQLQTALVSRVTIEQAKGALSRIHGVDVDVAFDLMRNFARRGGLRLSDVARSVVTQPDTVPGLTLV